MGLTMKVWITKYALTDGIQEDTSRNGPDAHGHIWMSNVSAMSQIFARGEWHASREDAVADANRRRDARIAALRKQIAALEKMTFE